jgi:hypothetical protein
LTGASAQSGDYDDRGAVGESDYYNAYDNYDEFGNKKKNKGDNWFASGAKQYTSLENYDSKSWASALNCWPANIEADTLVAPNHRDTAALEAAHFESGTARNPTTYPNQYDFNLAPQHVYGSFEVSNRAIERTVLTAASETTLHQEDPIQRSGLGGLYQYGHDTYNSVDHNQKLDDSSTRGTHWDHYKQARHAGCLYEKSDWKYSHTTFDKVFVANYYQGYAKFDGTASSPAFVDGTDATQVVPIWWHFFNAHVLPNNAAGGAQYPRAQMAPEANGYENPLSQKSIPLVMANPAYEGLGYLNFVVEYKNLDHGIGEDYREFIDSSTGGAALIAAAYQAQNTYRKINDCGESDGQECSGYGNSLNTWNGVNGHYYYDLYMGTWSIMGSTEAGTADRQRTWSLFPFNGETTPTTVQNLFTNATPALATVVDFEMDLYGNTADVDWANTADLVVSSFPHNNLGKDFRFNLRVLMRTHSLAKPKKDVALGDESLNTSNFHSYYFYKINDIAIEFPFNVAYALYHENRDGSVTTGARITVADPAADAWWKTLNNDNSNHPGYNVGGDPAEYEKQLDASTIIGNTNGQDNNAANVDDYQFMHRSAANVNMNIIPPVDLGTHAPNGGGYHRVRGFIDSATSFAANTAPDWCQAGELGRNVDLERTCGVNFHIKGLMNTYDERRGQRGTYQEIWVQLQYALGREGRGARDTECATAPDLDARCEASDPVQSPWPYLHFMASEIKSIQAVCNTNDVNNANTCKPQPVGPGQPNDAFYGGK